MQLVGQKWLNLVTWTGMSWSEGQHDLYFTVQRFCLISCDPMFDLKINVGLCDLYFMVEWVCLIPWRLFSCMIIIIWDYESVWPDAWPQNKCRWLWPICCGPVILCYILNAVWCINIILGDYWSVWPDVWPQNKCISLWPIFLGPLILYLKDYLMDECHIFR